MEYLYGELYSRDVKMKLLPITDPLLRKEPKEYDFDAEGDATKLCEDLFKKMLELGGVGLSANQIGIDKKIFVFGDGDKLTRYIINPTIIGLGDEAESMQEGCLSLPGVMLMVKRPTEVTLQYQDVKGEIVVETFLGLGARVVLHEYDHMLGQNFTQRVSKMKLDRAIKKAKKIKIKEARQSHEEQVYV